ncbi:MAG: nuclear transport factor 2 family protein [Rhodoplanes sp.]
MLHLTGMTDEDAILAANAAYYHAFATAGFAEMSRIWADEDISCIHLGWLPLIGRQAVLESYRNILSNPNRERIEHRDDTAIVSGSEGRVVCVEIVSGAALALAATNWFRRIDSAWRMVHHQASPIAALVAEPPPPSQRLN